MSERGYMKKNPDKEVFRAKFKETVKKFEEYFNDPEQHDKIFSELGFSYVEDGCDGFCPECEQKEDCEVDEEIKDEWEMVHPMTIH
jgi:hypothetical protein